MTAAYIIKIIEENNNYAICNTLVHIDPIFLFKLNEDCKEINNNIIQDLHHKNNNIIIYNRFLINIIKNKANICGKIELKINNNNNKIISLNAVIIKNILNYINKKNII